MISELKKLLKDEPGLKGKAIARKLNAEKKDVNSCLYANPDDFVRDDGYCWFLKAPAELRVEFEDDQWVGCASFERTLVAAGSPLDMDSASVVFVVPKKCNIMLDAAARFLALCNQLANINRLVTIDFSDCKATLGYFDRIGFLNHLDSRVTVIPDRPKVSRASIYKGNSTAVVEFGGVDPEEEDKDLINQLTNCFVQQSDSKFDTAAATVFGELIGNISEHSASPLQGFAALQKYGGRRDHIQTVVSDSGLGIAATLIPSIATHHPELFRYSNQNDYNIKIVTAVMTKGEISRFGAGRGLGFKSSREQAMKFDANLSVRQEDFALELVYEKGELVKIETHTDLVTIHGTHLCFDFFVD